jgi:hypothetical protein
MALLQRLGADDKRRVWEVYASKVVGFTLSDKCAIVNLSIQAGPLGLCALVPGVVYEIKHIERQNPIVVTHFEDPLLRYLLPTRYARMVSERRNNCKLGV